MQGSIYRICVMNVSY